MIVYRLLIVEVEGILGKELESLSGWLEENRLSLHLGKKIKNSK